MNLVNRLYDWGARRETLGVQPNHKNIQTLRGLCDEAADEIVNLNRRVYSLAVTYLNEGDMTVYEDMKIILRDSDPEAYNLLLDMEKEFDIEYS